MAPVFAINEADRPSAAALRLFFSGQRIVLNA